MIEKRKSIAILIFSLVGGGAERVVSILLNSLQHEYDIHLLLFNKTIDYEIPPNQKITYLDESIGVAESGITKIFKLPLMAWKVKKYCAANDISLCLAFMNRPQIVACISKSLGMKIPVIISERMYPSAYYKTIGLTGKVMNKLIKIFYPRADCIIPNSKATEIDLKEHYNVTKPKYKVIYNPIDIEKIATKCAEEVDEDYFSQFTFIHVGRFDPQKNHLLLLEAITYLKDLHFKVLFVGKGPLKETIVQKAKDLGISKYVEFLGFQKNPYKYIYRSDCFVFCSDFEGFPNVLLEALACKCPIISTDCFSGPREILDPSSDFTRLIKNEYELAEYGVLTPVGNALLLAKAMRKLYEQPSIKVAYQEKSYSHAKDFELKKMIGEFQTLIEEYE